MRLRVKLTFGQVSPQDEALGQVLYMWKLMALFVADTNFAAVW